MINQELTELVGVRLDKKTMIGLATVSDEWNIKPSQLVRHLIGEYLKKKGVM